MRRFRFPLEGLAKVRQLALEDAQRRFGKDERTRRQEEEQIMRLETEIAGATGRVARAGALDVRALASEDQHLGLLRTRRAEALQRLGGWIEAVEEDRERLLRTRRDAQALTRLRERRYLEFVREVLREETADLDEAGARRHPRLAPAA